MSMSLLQTFDSLLFLIIHRFEGFIIMMLDLFESLLMPVFSISQYIRYFLLFGFLVFLRQFSLFLLYQVLKFENLLLIFFNNFIFFSNYQIFILFIMWIILRPSRLYCITNFLLYHFTYLLIIVLIKLICFHKPLQIIFKSHQFLITIHFSNFADLLSAFVLILSSKYQQTFTLSQKFFCIFEVNIYFLWAFISSILAFTLSISSCFWFCEQLIRQSVNNALYQQYSYFILSSQAQLSDVIGLLRISSRFGFYIRFLTDLKYTECSSRRIYSIQRIIKNVLKKLQKNAQNDNTRINTKGIYQKILLGIFLRFYGEFVVELILLKGVNMSYQIRKLTPAKRNITTKDSKRPSSKSKQIDELSSGSPTKSPTKFESRGKLTSKMSLQTLISSKQTYVQKLNLTSTSWCVYDAKLGKYVGFREKNQRQIASITKVMTTIIAIEFFQMHQIPINTLVKVTESSAKLIGTTAQLKYDTWVYLWDLLYGSMLPSGNDAANMLAEYIGFFLKNPELNPSEDPYIDLSNENTNILIVQFIKIMNTKAQSLGLNSTTFSNPHGLQNAMNRSTAKDILILSQYASNNEIFRKVMNTDSYRYYYYELDKKFSEDEPIDIDNITQKYKKQRKRWWNTNSLLNKGWQGIKTGQTIAAGSCLASLKKDIFIVVLNCRDNAARFNETQKIYEWYTNSSHKSNSTTDQQQYSF